MPTTVAPDLRAKSDELQRVLSPAASIASRPALVRDRAAFWLTVAILGAIVLALASVFPPASSYRVANPAVQWMTGL
jgi:hypothetical protein